MKFKRDGVVYPHIIDRGEIFVLNANLPTVYNLRKYDNAQPEGLVQQSGYRLNIWATIIATTEEKVLNDKTVIPPIRIDRKYLEMNESNIEILF